MDELPLCLISWISFCMDSCFASTVVSRALQSPTSSNAGARSHAAKPHSMLIHLGPRVRPTEAEANADRVQIIVTACIDTLTPNNTQIPTHIPTECIITA